ncbi:hypothetical protein AB0J94_08370 [Micromonospora noduli]|uniref:Uncharacterized protein n=1 Tax=Micromonospora noduli TaxID=709876 RepID=A0A328MZ46_9ACTN|nr:hypothetical protein [Micromonospora noduli]KAB1926773.1 hypothetical protein F8280_09910 [Micromonospora noduli]RAN97546.1 hypothetical protein LAH08_04347 [Micromonospora noduli]RAO03648.1 hypothetical protein GUI43_05255 [Micromonospora noduli]RAO17341.1 hypothetical protein LUPAC07_02836 [Micromonospora noduli]RAO30541.1 hypothetical protein ONO23_04261 [Micromonospora noduli]
MAEPAKKVAQQTEDRLENLAETVRKKFDKVTDGTYRDRIIAGRFAEDGDHTGERGRAETERKQD